MEEYIQKLSDEGDVAEKGAEFTVSVEASLRKLAAFQLPFEGAWLLKIIQGLVASNTGAAITLSLTRDSIELKFTMPSTWTVQNVVKALFSPNVSDDRSLQHFITGLRPLAINERRPLTLDWPNGERIRWDGSKLHREYGSGTSKLRVQQTTKGGGLIPFVKTVSKMNATLTKVLEQHAFACPVPLRLGGRRIDTLVHCPNQGANDVSRPIGVICADFDSPSFIPPGRALTALQEGRRDEFSGFDSFVEEAFTGLSLPPQLSALGLVSAHLKIIHGQGGVSYQVENSKSFCYWVEDGVVLETEELALDASSVSVGVLLNAAGLGRDLSNFRIIDSEAKRKRQKAALVSLKTGLKEVSLESLQAHWERDSDKAGEWAAGAISAAMVAGTIGLKPIVLPAVAVTSVAFYVLGRRGRKNNRKIIRELQNGLTSLQKAWPGAT